MGQPKLSPGSKSALWLLSSFVLPPVVLWIDLSIRYDHGPLPTLLLFGGAAMAMIGVQGGWFVHMLTGIGYILGMGFVLFILAATLVCGYYHSCL